MFAPVADRDVDAARARHPLGQPKRQGSVLFDGRQILPDPAHTRFHLGLAYVPEERRIVPGLSVRENLRLGLIASAKRDSRGHKLRHAVVDWARDTDQDIEVMGRGYIPFEAKADGLAPYGSTKRALTYFTNSVAKELDGGPISIHHLSPGIVVTDLLVGDYAGDPEGFEKAKRIFNILGDTVETVTPYLADEKNDAWRGYLFLGRN